MKSIARENFYMQPKMPKLLADIKDAAAFILSGTEGKTLAAYQQDRQR